MISQHVLLQINYNRNVCKNGKQTRNNKHKGEIYVFLCDLIDINIQD